MRVLVWQWGRRGGGPRFAAQLASAFGGLTGTEALLSLSSRAEILQEKDAPHCDLPVPTYTSAAHLAARVLASPWMIARLTCTLRELRPDLAICALPGPLDWIFATALRRVGVPFGVIAHDAIAHPGDGYPLQMLAQRRLLRSADAVIVLSAHVAEQVLAGRMIGPRAKLIRSSHPPMMFGRVAPAFAHAGPVRLLNFGRLLPYKGLDLLAAALQRTDPDLEFTLRVVGSGPESDAVRTLRAMPRVAVENRWVPESEIGPLLGWSDALVLPYREASQSGVASAALAAGRFVIATRVGGLAEQLANQPLGRLCEPDPENLAAAIAHFVTTPPPAPAVSDPAQIWRDQAEQILREI